MANCLAWPESKTEGATHGFQQSDVPTRLLGFSTEDQESTGQPAEHVRRTVACEPELLAGDSHKHGLQDLERDAAALLGDVGER